MKKLVLDVQGQVAPVCSRSHITYRFPLGERVRKLTIHFAYEPKNMDDKDQAKALIMDSIAKYTEPEHAERVQAKWESFLPLKNLITVSVDDPVSHRGAGHRHDPEQVLVIAEAEASPGFVQGPMPAGLWDVTLSMHAVVTDSCRYTLQIWGEE
ncbi:hypothetical protein SD70_25850 [Gordoniibacillus kamchatkensis]|uniref:Uncharacterized protein n=1 Tax=Gordoniibacillus kamchatkensis TaxID=1590651 RepID=A0ABR5ABW4_9BACL|nr:hypothetical protein [Paenibacillus sp. VKM B-2647]KIL38550.1 hypothetical protein SD70_25850 [Paenibacillus sp. VKM B-2647]